MAVAFVQQVPATFVKVAGTTLAAPWSVSSSAGNLIVACLVFDNAGTSKPTVTSLSKPAGETASWTLIMGNWSPGSTAGAAASSEMWAIKTTVDWVTPTITATFDVSTVMKAIGFTEYSGVDVALRSTAAMRYQPSTTIAVATTSGTTPLVGDLAVGLIFAANVATAPLGDTDTLGGSWSTPYEIGSTGGATNTNNIGITQYKILTAASHQTYNSAASTSTANGSTVAIFKAAEGGAAFPLTGMAVAVTTTTGAIGIVSGSQAYPLAGTAEVTSATSGSLRANVTLSGDAAAVSTTQIDGAYDDIYGDTYRDGLTANHPLAGTVAGVTATTGVVAAVHPLGGTATATTTTTGTIGTVVGAQDYPLAGVVTAITTTTGSPAAVHPLAGVTPATSATTGNPAAAHPLTGTAVATSATTGDIGQIVGSVAYPLSGTASASSTTSGTLTWLNLALAAVTVVIAATSGTIAAVHPLSGTTVSTSSSSGTLRSARPLAGTVAGTSATTGNIVAVHPLTGTGSASSTTTVGSIAGKFALAGVSGAVSATTGTIEKSPRLPKAETFIDPFTTQIDLAKWDTYGTVVWEAGYIAAPELPNDYSGLSSKNLYDLMDSYVFVGMESPAVMTTVSETALLAYTADDLNGLGMAIQWTGTKRQLVMIYLVDGVQDTAVIDYDPVAHAYVSVQMLNGQAEWWTSPDRVAWTKRQSGATSLDLSRVKIWLICGQWGAGATQGIGYFDNLSVPGAGPVPIAGVTVAYSATSGNPKAKRALAGTAAAVSVVTGSPAAVHPLAGVTAATSAAAGSLAVRFPLTGTAVATSTTTGTLKAVHPLAGTADAVSTTSGTINLVGGAQSYPLSGSAAAVSSVRISDAYSDIYEDLYEGGLRANRALTGMTVALSTTSGTINKVSGAQTYPLSGSAAAVSSVRLSDAYSDIYGDLYEGGLRANRALTGITPAITTTSGTIGIGVVTGRPKTYIGVTWQKKPAKVGSTGLWVEKPMKKWDGSQWKGI